MLRDGQTGDWIGTFLGHKGAVWQARLSPNASLAATGSADFSAKVWDTFTGEAIHTLSHGHIVRAVAFPKLERARILATGGMEKKLRIWDLSVEHGSSGNGVDGSAHGGVGASSYEVGAGVHGGTIKSIIWGSDPNVLITACDDRQVRWWDLRMRDPIVSQAVEGGIGSCELDAGGEMLSVASGRSVYVFDGARAGQLIKRVRLSYDVVSVAISDGREGRKMVTGSGGDTWVRVYDFETERELGRSFPLSGSFSPAC